MIPVPDSVLLKWNDLESALTRPAIYQSNDSVKVDGQKKVIIPISVTVWM